MAGIKLTPARRSQLLEQLLKQNAQQWQQNPQSWGETIAKMLAQGIRQRGINQLQEDEAAANRTTKANETNLLKSISGEQISSPMAQPGIQNDLFPGGAPTLPQQPTASQLAGLLGTDNPMGAMYASKAIEKHFTPPTTPEGFTLADGAQRYDAFGNLIANNPKDQTPLVSVVNKDVPPDKLRDPKMLDFFEKGQAAASDAYVAVNAADNMLKSLDNGAFTGITAPAAEAGARVLALIGDKDNPPEAIAEAISNLENSQFYDTQGGILVGQIIKLFGSGTGLSDADREYAASIAGALRKMEEGALRKVLNELKMVKGREVTRWNNKARNVAAKDLDFVQPWLVGTELEKRIDELLRD